MGKNRNLREWTFAKILQAFSEQEVKSFRKYLSCDLFNTNLRLILLYDHFVKTVYKSRKKHISAEEFLLGTEFNLNRLHIRFSQLLALIEDFMVVQDRN